MHECSVHSFGNFIASLLHEPTIFPSTIPFTLSFWVSLLFAFLVSVLSSFFSVELTTTLPLSPSAGLFPVLRSILASYFSFHLACLSKALSTGCLSYMAGPHGATISGTTCLICRLICRPSFSMRTTSPKRIESFGSETRWFLWFPNCYASKPN